MNESIYTTRDPRTDELCSCGKQATIVWIRMDESGVEVSPFCGQSV